MNERGGMEGMKKDRKEEARTTMISTINIISPSKFYLLNIVI